MTTHTRNAANRIGRMPVLHTGRELLDTFDVKAIDLLVSRTSWERLRKPTGVKHFGVAVCRRSPLHSFIARCRINGKEVVLGRFETPEEAHLAYAEARKAEDAAEAASAFDVFAGTCNDLF